MYQLELSEAFWEDDKYIYREEDTLIQVHMDWRTQEDKYLEEWVIDIIQRYIPAELPD